MTGYKFTLCLSLGKSLIHLKTKSFQNKKVLLRERKRHTARHAASTPYVVLSLLTPPSWIWPTPPAAGPDPPPPAAGPDPPPWQLDLTHPSPQLTHPSPRWPPSPCWPPHGWPTPPPTDPPLPPSWPTPLLTHPSPHGWPTPPPSWPTPPPTDPPLPPVADPPLPPPCGQTNKVKLLPSPSFGCGR